MKNKISFRYRTLLFAFIMSCITSLITSGIVVNLHTQTFAQLIKSWPSSFVVVWPIVFIAILIIAPAVNKFLNLFVEDH